MQNIYNLNTDAINRLTGIDPTLSPDWQEILEEIIPQLDEESQTIVKNTILSPKGITYSKSAGTARVQGNFLPKNQRRLLKFYNHLLYTTNSSSKLPIFCKTFTKLPPPKRYTTIL